LVLMPILEADFHARSYGFRPKRRAHQAIAEIQQAVQRGYVEIIDADLSKYFDTIPHRERMKAVARRVSDGSVLRLIKSWRRAPMVEEDKDGTKRVIPNRRGTPQGGVISPLLANLYSTVFRVPGLPVLPPLPSMVLIRLNLAAHLGDETVVEFFGGVVAGGLELDLKGGHFDEAG